MNFFRCSGALMCDQAVEDLTQDLEQQPEGNFTNRQETIAFYGGRYFVCETITAAAARKIAEALGGVYLGDR